MANRNAAFGFNPIGHISGAMIIARPFLIDSNTGTNLFSGDVVKAEAGGNIDASAADDGAIVNGVFAGARYLDGNGKWTWSNFILAANIASYTNVIGHVYTDPGIIYEVQVDGSMAITDINAAANHVVGTGSQITGMSGHQLNATVVTGGSAQFLIMDIVKKPDNAFGANVNMRVKFNEHFYSGAAVNGI